MIDPFLRLSANTDIVKGYNTDGALQFDEDNSKTNSLLLTDTPTVTLISGVYRQFLLDINQTGNDPLLSLHELQIFVGNSPSLTAATVNANGTLSFGSNAVLIYDLDSGTDGDSTVELDFSLKSGSGSGDIFAYIPDSLFVVPDASYKYVYLYSAFGDPNNDNDGFEEWSASNPGLFPGPLVNTPEPSTFAIFGLGGLGFAIGAIRRRFRKAA